MTPSMWSALYELRHPRGETLFITTKTAPTSIFAKTVHPNTARALVDAGLARIGETERTWLWHHRDAVPPVLLPEDAARELTEAEEEVLLILAQVGGCDAGKRTRQPGWGREAVVNGHAAAGLANLGLASTRTTEDGRPRVWITQRGVTQARRVFERCESDGRETAGECRSAKCKGTLLVDGHGPGQLLTSCPRCRRTFVLDQDVPAEQGVLA